jgi:F420-non-reducing hydrogenase iron-sulfur subunit
MTHSLKTKEQVKVKQVKEKEDDNINEKEWEPKIVAFLCNWCSYAGADLAGTSRIQYPSNIRILRVPCSGRINPLYIIKAVAGGADGVLVSGCHPGDCHYITGNMYARRRFVMLKRLLTTAGIEPERVQFTWVSASEGGGFADAVKQVTDNVKKLGPSRMKNRTKNKRL